MYHQMNNSINNYNHYMNNIYNTSISTDIKKEVDNVSVSGQFKVEPSHTMTLPSTTKMPILNIKSELQPIAISSSNNISTSTPKQKVRRFRKSIKNIINQSTITESNKNTIVHNNQDYKTSDIKNIGNIGLRNHIKYVPTKNSNIKVYISHFLSPRNISPQIKMSIQQHHISQIHQIIMADQRLRQPMVLGHHFITQPYYIIPTYPQYNNIPNNYNYNSQS